MEQERLNADGLAYSVRFADTMDTVIMPRLEECRTDRTVAGQDGVPLFVSRSRSRWKRFFSSFSSKFPRK